MDAGRAASGLKPEPERDHPDARRARCRGAARSRRARTPRTSARRAPARRDACNEPPAHAFAPGKPLRVRGKRTSWTASDNRGGAQHRRRVAGREQHIRRRAPQRPRRAFPAPSRVPPAPGSTTCCMSRALPANADGAVREQREPMRASGRQRLPVVDQARQVSPDARRPGYELPRVNGDVHVASRGAARRRRRVPRPIAADSLQESAATRREPSSHAGLGEAVFVEHAPDGIGERRRRRRAPRAGPHRRRPRAMRPDSRSTTGTPSAIASRAGSPKPSCQRG